ncbi:MAG: hypothetical protein WBV91_10165 [Desulfobacterales bacterium]|jgi:hypothetical protein
MEPELEVGPTLPKEHTLRIWIVVALLLVLIVSKGLFSYFVVGDLGMPDWNYGAVADIPGESPYAIYAPLPHPQHVRGAKGE